MRRRISIFLLTLLWCFSFISCNTTDNDFSETNSDDEIIVEASIYKPEAITPTKTVVSRAAKLTNSNLTTFGMYGFYNTVIKVNNTSYTKNGTLWKSSRPTTWSAGAMDFYAISPSFNISTSPLTQSMTYPSLSISYTIPTNTAEQFDILYSSILNLKKTDNSSKIIFSFKPGMHYFGFTAQNTIGTDYQVFAKKIIIHNMIQNGTFQFGSTANTGNWTAASGGNATFGNDVMEFANPIEITSTRVNLTGNEYFIVMPQTISKWNTTDSTPIPISTADENKNWYIEIVGQIIKNNSDGTKTYLLGNKDDSDPNNPQYQSVYFPQVAKACKIGIGTTWNIVFNGGYNQNGETYLDHLDNGGDVIVKVAEWFPSSIDVEEWTPYSENIEF
jgi:hypothetical protein